jgi:outer membrane protein assembly factor BamE (lipoprotein component of BamABCDE complex)
MSRTKIGSIVVALLAAIGSSGCIVIPIPHPETVLSGRQPSAQELAVLKVGSTSRADVLRLLGDPYVHWNHDHTLVYHWTTSNLAILAELMGATGQGVGGIIDSPINRFLIMEFDDSGRLIRSGAETARPFQSEEQYLDELRHRFNPSTQHAR